MAKENHISFSLKAKFKLKGFTIKEIKKGSMNHADLIRDEYFIIEKKYSYGLGIIYKDGKVIVPYGNFKLVDATEDTILVFNEDNLAMENRSLVNGDVLYTVLSYSDTDACYKTLHAYDKQKDEFFDALKLCFIKDANKRWRISTRYGVEIASKIIEYELFMNRPNEKNSEHYMFAALRFEDHFGILLPNQKIITCTTIKNFYDNFGERFVPMLLGKENLKKELEYYFLGYTNYEHVFDTLYEKITMCQDTCHFIAANKDKSLVILDECGNVLTGKSYVEILSFTSNRAFVRLPGEEYYHMIDENGREIRNENLKICKIVRNLEKIKYGAFTMTLAIVETVEHGYLYVDKELHPYFFEKT